jgi:hypothetical protein
MYTHTTLILYFLLYKFRGKEFLWEGPGNQGPCHLRSFPTNISLVGFSTGEYEIRPRRYVGMWQGQVYQSHRWTHTPGARRHEITAAINKQYSKSKEAGTITILFCGC